MKKKNKVLCSVIAGTAGMVAAVCHTLNKCEKEEFSDSASPVGGAAKVTLYEHYGKRVMDVMICGIGLAFLLPVIAISTMIVFMEDPGHVIFKQKRVGIHKSYFYIHKLRSMKQSCPDIPTHLMENPDQYLLKSGKKLRKYSIDELPQLIDILRGKMSLVGPRPALWNQDDLVAEREKYGANDVMPGLTGWAQINGRDELEIADKAKMDGEYVKALKKSSLSGFLMDCRCLFGTVTSVLHHDGVVEGGTGELHKEEQLRHETHRNTDGESDEVESVIGFDKPVTVNASAQKRVLITGAESYIGTSFETYAKKRYGSNFTIDILDMQDEGWRAKDFRGYDIVYHVAGIAHADLGHVSEETIEKYYRVNTGLAIETAEKAKAAGVKLFVFMSSMIVYGDSAPVGKSKMITAETKPEPANFYGDSKWQADKGVRALADGDFKVVVLRPPMIYGKGSKGNYKTLAGLAKKLPVFPDVENRRSMLYIENLCEFLCQLMLVEEKNFSEHGNLFFPQNPQYTRTSDMVGLIAKAAGHKILISKLLAPAVFLAEKVPGKTKGLVDKAFGNNCYEQKLSVYEGMDYQKVDLQESVRRTEGMGQNIKPKALMLASVASMIDQFNMNNIQILLDLGYDVDVAANFTDGGTITRERVKDLERRLADLSVTVYDVPIPRKITKLGDIVKSYQLVKCLCEKQQYQIVHCHSPIGGVVARLAAKNSRKKGTKVIYTAHGFHFYQGAPVINWLIFYPIEKICSYWTDVLITINREDYAFAMKHMKAGRVEYISGVGIDVEEIYAARQNMEETRKSLGVSDRDIVLFSVGELSHRKNHEVIIHALKESNNPHIQYFICGQGELEKYLKDTIDNLELGKQVHLLGYRTDVYELYHAADIFVFPSCQEGLPVALMEAMASGLPVVVSRIRGNVDLIEEGKGGYLCEPDDVAGFISGIGDLVGDEESRIRFGEENRKKIAGFDVSIINDKMKKIYELVR